MGFPARRDRGLAVPKGCWECDHGPMSRWWGVFLLLGYGGLEGCKTLEAGRGTPPTPEQVFARDLDEVRRKVEEARGVKFLRTPEVERIPPERRCCVVDSISQSAWVARQAQDTSDRMDRLLVAAGLLKPGISANLQRVRLDCMATRAMYLMASRKILVFVDSVPGSERDALAHEMVHALQGEKVDLVARVAQRREPDEVLGLLGALEGEAEFVSTRALGMRSPQCESEPPGAMSVLYAAIRSIAMFQPLPPSVILPAYAPYVYGQNLACVLQQRYGLAGLDTLLARPPRGSWQLWHVDAYLADRAPVDWDTAWEGFGRLPAGWSPLGQLRAGEARLAGLPLTWVRKRADEVLSGSGLGWAGDRLWVFTHPRWGDGLVWRLAFVDRNKAQQFASMWWSVRRVRSGANLPVWSSRKGVVVWSDRKKRVSQMHLVGNEVVLVEGFDAGDARRLVERALARETRRLE